MADNDHVDMHLLFTVMGSIVSDRSWKELGREQAVETSAEEDGTYPILASSDEVFD